MTAITNNQCYEIPCLYVGTVEANVNMSVETTPGTGDYQFAPVDVAAASGSGLLGPSGLVVPAAGAAILGILQNAPALAEAGSVMVLGVSKARVGSGGWLAGQLLMADGATPPNLIVATSTNFAVAKALTPGTAGAVGTVFLMNCGKQ